MSLAIYLAHSVSEAEQAVLWELQANSAAHGIRTHLASYHPSKALSASRAAEINRADAVVAILARPSQAVTSEIKYALSVGKPVFVYRTLDAPWLAHRAGLTVFTVAPGTAAPELLADISARIKKVRLPQDKEGSTALGAFLGLGAVLLVLSLLTKDE
jgi:hypothetical protein